MSRPDEPLNLAGRNLNAAIADYIVQSQMWDQCDPNDFDNARKEILASVEVVIERISRARTTIPRPEMRK